MDKKEYNRQWYQNNKENRAAYMRKWRSENKDKVSEQNHIQYWKRKGQAELKRYERTADSEMRGREL